MEQLLKLPQPGCLCYVESIIGGGKTIYCREVGPRLGFRVFYEPLDKERLTRFYSNPEKYAYHYQVYMLHKRIGIQMLAACEALYSDTYAGAMVDRSLFGDLPFAKMHAKKGNIEPLDWLTYQLTHHNMKLMIWPPTILVYLSVEPEVALERVRRRIEAEGRKYEGGLTLGYLRDLRALNEEMVEDAQNGKWPWGHAVKIHYSDGNLDTRSKTEWDAVASSLRRRIGLKPSKVTTPEISADIAHAEERSVTSENP